MPEWDCAVRSHLDAIKLHDDISWLQDASSICQGRHRAHQHALLAWCHAM